MVRRYDAFVRQLPHHRDELATLLRRKSRAAVRQARQREGLEVRHDADQLPLVWRLYSRSMRRLASLSYPFRFFRELLERLGENAGWR